MPRPNTKLKVKVTATLHEDEGVSFDIMWKGASGAWHGGPIVLPKDSGEYSVEFKLDDKTGLKLNFEPAAADAIWVNEGACPKSFGECNDKGQIEGKNVDVGNKTLKLLNLNLGNPCNLHYRIRLKGDTWMNSKGQLFGPSYDKDPEFRNGGGR